jgi:hypothetical protein
METVWKFTARSPIVCKGLPDRTFKAGSARPTALRQWQQLQPTKPDLPAHGVVQGATCAKHALATAPEAA